LKDGVCARQDIVPERDVTAKGKSKIEFHGIFFKNAGNSGINNLGAEEGGRETKLSKL
jgi:hypothetical protein